MNQLVNNVLFILVGFILCLLITTKSCKDKKESIPSAPNGTTTVVTKVDTIYIPKVDTFVVTKYKPVPQIVRVIDTTKAENLTVERLYADTMELEDKLSISYEATVRGELDALSFKLDDRRPTRMIRETVHKTTYPRGVYAGLGLDGAANSAVKLSYVDKRQVVGFSYKPKAVYDATPNNFTELSKFEISYQRSLFQF